MEKAQKSALRCYDTVLSPTLISISMLIYVLLLSRFCLLPSMDEGVIFVYRPRNGKRE